MSADLLPNDGPVLTPPLARQPSCSACDHEQHAPLPCGYNGTCACADVPVNGIHP